MNRRQNLFADCQSLPEEWFGFRKLPLMAQAHSQAGQARCPLGIAQLELFGDLKRFPGESLSLNKISVVVRLVVKIDLGVPFEAFRTGLRRFRWSLCSCASEAGTIKKKESASNRTERRDRAFISVTSVAQRAATIDGYSWLSPIRNRYRSTASRFLRHAG